MNLKILVFYHKILTGCIYYNEQVYKQDSILAGGVASKVEQTSISLAWI
jgi:hypothetical protein